MMKKITIGQLCKPNVGHIKLDDDRLIDYFDIASIDNINKKITGFTTYTFVEAPSRARRMIKKDNILVSTIRPNLNAVALFDMNTQNVPVASTGFCVLDCKEDTNPRFLFYYLQSRFFVNEMVSQATGASYPAVSDKIVRSAHIPVYSYDEQVVIADMLDKVTYIIAKRKQQLAKLDELVKARFVEMFGNPVLNDKGWKLKSLSNLTKKIGSGATPKGGKEVYQENGVAFIRSMNVYNGKFEYKELAYISDEQACKLDGVTVKEKDVLLNITGASVARSCVVPTDILPARVNQHVCIIRCGESIIPEFLNKILIDDNYQNFLWNIAGSGATREAITKQQVENLQIITPPIERQGAFVEFCKQIEGLKILMQRSLEQMKTLKKALMQQYFG